MKTTRAKAGGQHGKNGEWYEGGQFLPSSETTEKGAFSKDQRQARPRKQEIAPYRWEISGKSAIWPKVEAVCKFHKTGYSKETGAQGWLEIVAIPSSWTQEGIEEVRELVKKWNSGERWI